MRNRWLVVATVAAAFVCGRFFGAPDADVKAGCANNPFRSGTLRMAPGAIRSVTTLSASKRLVITSVTSGAFHSSSHPWLEIFAGSNLVGVVPGKCNVLGWHFATHFEGVDTQGGFNVPGGEELSLHFVAEESETAVPISV